MSSFSSHMAQNQFSPSLLKGQHYSVGGLGKNGLAVTEKLLALGASVYAWDDHETSLPKEIASHPNLTYETRLTRNIFRASHHQKRFDALILSPGIPHHLPKPHPIAQEAQALSIPILSDAEILYKAVRLSGSKARFISITGTNGKSTTTALLSHILRHSAYEVAEGGNLGTAALALPLLNDNGIYIIEMSSYMLERLETYHANAAIFLNLTPDHLERHGTLENYGAAKYHIFDNMTKNDLAIFGEENTIFKEYASKLQENHIRCTLLPPQIAYNAQQAPSLPGKHNAQNISACKEICNFLTIKEDIFFNALKSFPGLDHRLQKVHTYKKIDFINDSKATNAEATAHALAAYDSILWIAGGVAKSEGIEPLAPLFSKIAHSFLIGQDAPLLAQTLTKYHQEFTISKTLEQAIDDATHMAQEKNLHIILLSPACASFDQFKNFEERGTFFKMHAKKYLEQKDTAQ